jgi:hypothetical protein
MNKKFILCVGVPKAGTTWLFRCLQAHTSVNLGHKKEYHVFDTHFYPELNSYRVKIPENKDDSNSFYKKYVMEKNFDKKLQDDHDSYGAYFAKILQNPDIFITGDFTPTYCVLREGEFEYIKSLSNRYGLDAHIIYLVRDPVERILSYVKMAYKFKEYLGRVLPPDLSLNEFLASICFGQLNYDVTNYQETITSLVNSFDESKLYFGVYETMHTHRELGRLSDFLGIAIDPAWTEKRINANAPSNSEFDTELVRKIQLAFNDQFLFCQQFFKDQNLSLVWKNYS